MLDGRRVQSSTVDVRCTPLRFFSASFVSWNTSTLSRYKQLRQPCIFVSSSYKQWAIASSAHCDSACRQSESDSDQNDDREDNSAESVPAAEGVAGVDRRVLRCASHTHETHTLHLFLVDIRLCASCANKVHKGADMSSPLCRTPVDMLLLRFWTRTIVLNAFTKQRLSSLYRVHA